MKPSDNNNSQLLKQLEWQCRRGMLELDVILGPFLAEHFSSIDCSEQAAFVELLKQPDPDLYTWIMGYGDCPNPQWHGILKLIQSKMALSS